MGKKSAGILLYRIRDHHPEVMLVHPGGPFWKHKDAGAWSVPKGEYTTEDPFKAALREFEEETGMSPRSDNAIPLHPILQKSGKHVIAWAIKGDLDVRNIKSNLFEITLSGKKQLFPEVDKAAWFSLPEAAEKINPAQVSFLHELAQVLAT